MFSDREHAKADCLRRIIGDLTAEVPARGQSALGLRGSL
jgi:hypothetical protein